MHSPVKEDGLGSRLIAFLEQIPLTPWWWLAKRRTHDQQRWLRHVRHYY